MKTSAADSSRVMETHSKNYIAAFLNACLAVFTGYFRAMSDLFLTFIDVFEVPLVIVFGGGGIILLSSLIISSVNFLNSLAIDDPMVANRPNLMTYGNISIHVLLFGLIAVILCKIAFDIKNKMRDYV
jgi:hypothetical protein